MRFVHYPLNAIAQAWLKKASEATIKAAAKLTDVERKAYVSSRSDVWSTLKETLEHLSAGKCWYTEARDNKVSYWQVDHYRPKALYPWLAFSWDNLRLSGAKPNLRKSDDFPLGAGSPRGSDAEGIKGEQPLLLDPTRWGDPDLLTFKADGEPVCATPADPFSKERVTTTVKLLGLDSEGLCAHRREKWRSCERKLKKLQKLLETNRHQANPEGGELIDEICRDLEALYDDEAEFTSTAWSCAQELNASRLIELARYRARLLRELEQG
ncbi:hypothetical protein [Methylobacterium sp. Leaf91]|uniref:hypothetical protein n=1 Tax=Methylobacterium sp. Leaf91 TaxID=1736247 RepID=UPI000AE7B59E|nr:hypothetical protein [Methylobacterium sp. Leaf91]